MSRCQPIMIDDTDESSDDDTYVKERDVTVFASGHETPATAIAAIQCNHVKSSMIPLLNKEPSKNNDVKDSSALITGGADTGADANIDANADVDVKETEPKNAIAAVDSATITINAREDSAAIATRHPSVLFVSPETEDILFGSGVTYLRPGNRSMMDLVDEYMTRYTESSYERRRSIVEGIVSKLSDKGSRFLRKYDNEDAEGWTEVPKKDALKKVQAAFGTRKQKIERRIASDNEARNTPVSGTHSHVQERQRQRQDHQKIRGNTSFHQQTPTQQPQKRDDHHQSTSFIVSRCLQKLPVTLVAQRQQQQQQQHDHQEMRTNTLHQQTPTHQPQNRDSHQQNTSIIISPAQQTLTTISSVQQQSQSRSVSTTQAERAFVKEDVLFGRDKQSMTHPGNLRMMNLVNSYTSGYNKGHIDYEEKRSIVEKIIDLITREGGRFWRKSDNKGCSVSYWTEVSKQEAFDKVRMAFNRISRNYKARSQRNNQTDNTVTTTTAENTIIIHPTSLDVIFQQGASFHDQPGNRTLLSLVEKSKNEYSELPSGASRKRVIIDAIVDQLIRDGGRFLRRHHHYGECSWTEVSKSTAVEKVRSSFSKYRKIPSQRTLSQNTSSSKGWLNNRNQQEQEQEQLATNTSNEEMIVGSDIIENEYKKLEVVVDLLRRVHLLDDYFNQSIDKLYPELTDTYSKIIDRPIHLNEICQRIKDRQYQNLHDAYTEICMMFDNFIEFYSYPGNNFTDPTPISIVSHLRNFFKNLWQEHMLQSDFSTLSTKDRCHKAMEERAINREKRSASSLCILMDSDCLKYSAQVMGDLIKKGGRVDAMDNQPIWGETSSNNENDKVIIDLIVKKLRKFETDLNEMVSQMEIMSVHKFESCVRKIYTQGHGLENLNTVVRDRIASRLERYIGQLTVPLHEEYCRGSFVSSFWGSIGAIVWARISCKSAFWPALVLGIIAPDDQMESWQSSLTERNDARCPVRLKPELEKARKKIEREIVKQRKEGGDPQSYFLVEFLGVHDFNWVRKSNTVQPFNASEDPNDNDSLRSRKISRSCIKGTIRSKSYHKATDEAKKALEEYRRDQGDEIEEDGSDPTQPKVNAAVDSGSYKKAGVGKLPPQDMPSKITTKRKTKEQQNVSSKRSKAEISNALLTSDTNTGNAENNNAPVINVHDDDFRIRHDSDHTKVQKENQGEVELDLSTPPTSGKEFSMFLYKCFNEGSRKRLEKLMGWLDMDDETLYGYCEQYLVVERVLDLMDTHIKSIPFVWCCAQLLFKYSCGRFSQGRANRIKVQIAKHEGIRTLLRAIDNHQNERILAVLWGLLRVIMGYTEARSVVTNSEKVLSVQSALRCLLLIQNNSNASIEISTKILCVIYFVVDGDGQSVPHTAEFLNDAFISTQFCTTLMEFVLVQQDPWLKNEKIVEKLLQVLGACLLIPSIVDTLQANDYEEKLRPICVNCVRNVPSINVNAHKEYVHLLNLLVMKDYRR